MAYPVEIRTKSLHIREFRNNDAERLFQLTSDPDVVRYLEFEATSRGESQGLLDFAIGSSESVPRSAYVLAIVDPLTEIVIGSCGLEASADDPSIAEVSFMLGRDQWGKGFAGELMPALIELAQGPAGFSLLYAVVHPDNVASIRVLEHLGMTIDGTVPGEASREGRWREGLHYSILFA